MSGQEAGDSFRCGICESKSEWFAESMVLQKYRVQYFRCTSCNAVQTERPYWLEEAYSSPIASIDIGVVNRAIEFSKVCSAVILLLLDCNASFVDYGGGYGLFVRVMRDLGFDFYNFDKYCPNLFAKHFQADLSFTPRYELATAFEVLEHFVEPKRNIDEVLRFSRNVLFNTALLPEPTPRPGDWWYYAPDTGQHVAFYTREALTVVARRASLNFYTDGIALHLFTERPLNRRLVRFVLSESRLREAVVKVMRRRLRKDSLLIDDFAHVSGLRLQ